MGRDATFYCETCRKSYYLGYGSYRSWHDDCRSVEEYDARAGDDAELKKNANMRACLVEHGGHEFFTQSDDWTFRRDGWLVYDDGLDGRPLVDLRGWEHVDLFEASEK